MKYIVLIIVLQFSNNIFSQQSNFDVLLQKNKSDKSLYFSLLNFKKGGIEQSLKADSFLVDTFIEVAKSFVGTPHCMGGISHKCIDCSGLLYVSFQKIGIYVPHSSEGIARYGRIIINQDSLKKGDLIFFIKTYKTTKFITHTGIYLGNSMFIHTSASRGVTISDLRGSYYQNHFIFGTNIF